VEILEIEGFHGVFLFAPNMSTDNREKLNAVNPLLREKALKILSLAAADGFQLTVTQAVRTFAEQDALFAQGRTRKGPIVTNARGGQSWHNFGMAVDLAFVVDGKISWDDKLYSKIGKWASVAGLDWGGDWKKFKDLPHVQLSNLASKPPANWIAAFRAGGIENAWKLYA
jgi:peptidoglycan L-alanyl-D-glutamate endopeptidase CwlK